jgi:4-hydroxybenzoate polyprenyltransferase
VDGTRTSGGRGTVAVLPTRLADLARSCHPAPTVAVTAFVTVLAGAAGNTAGTCVLVAAAVLTGQLSIGWSNDRLDRSRDRTAGRTDKPIAMGRLPLRTVDSAIAAVVAATVALSFALGWRAGLLHLAAVGCGWAYNVRLKATWWSWLPYAAAFGALPAVATLARADHPWPAAWAVAAGACLGVTANLTNALPDLAGDERTGIRGLPHRVGASRSLLLAAVMLLAAAGAVAFGPAGSPRPGSWIGFAVSAVVVLAGTPAALRRPMNKASFYAVIVLVGIDLALIVATGHGLR